MDFSRIDGRFTKAVCCSALCLLTILADRDSAGAQDGLASEPFTVFVAREKTFARCGPSDEYYRTDALRHGQELDVYLETDEGWLGVRPPESAFCWIPESTVEVHRSGELATVTEDRTVCWIGTHLGRARQYRWQVQLAEGEEVAILGRSERDGPDGPQTWLRIVPPPGEFRWVHRDQIAESAEELVASLRNLPAPTRVAEAEPLVESKPKPENGLDAIVKTAGSIKNRLTGKSSQDDFKPSAAEVAATQVQTNPGLAVAGEMPELKEAPKPRSTTVAQTDVVGSGLRPGVQPVPTPQVAQTALQNPTAPPTPTVAAQPQAVIQQQTIVQQAPVQPEPVDASIAASTEFKGRPRLLDIGAQAAAPQNNVAAADSNWVSGVARRGQMPGPAVRPAAFTQRVGNQTNTSGRTNTVSSASIQQVANEVRDAGVDQLQLALSRLMAAGASAAETQPIATRARNLALSSQDPVAAGRARLVAERAEQYQRVARRRDGNTVIRESGIPVIPSSGAVTPASANVPAPATVPVQGNNSLLGSETHSGYLVQVYSARTNSPPFALTDRAGNTTAYVTPLPGINLRSHLNSHVRVIGKRGFLRGLNMPHIMVSQAARTPE